jgi:putative peptidoglycan lipid II flippase
MSLQKKILLKTAHVGLSTLLSRLFGIVREILMVRYLGASGLSDAFLTAYKIPNSLRKIFAEGALSAAFIPTVVHSIKKNNRDSIGGLMSLGFLFFEGTVLLLCAFIMYYAHDVISFIAPGFSPEQIDHTVPMVHILMPFIFFISSSALLAGAMQAVSHFFIPAFTPIIMNLIFIIGIITCLFFNLPVTALCWFVLSSGIVHFIMHVITYINLHFTFSMPTAHDFTLFKQIIGQFLLCLPSISLMEIALFIDTSFASWLKPGSISLLFYANRFIGIPLGVFAVAFSTILLPHFSRISAYSPKRLHFYLFESARFIFWITIPVALLMAFFANDIFSTIFLSKKFTIEQVREAGTILQTFLCGLFSFSLNKIILNIFYSMHAAWIPAIIALCTTTVNIILNIFFIEYFQTAGLALATTCSSILQTILFLTVLHKKYSFRLYLARFMFFITRYSIQLILFSSLFIITYHMLYQLILMTMPSYIAEFLLIKIGLWLWVGPLATLFFGLLWYLRSNFGIKIYFLG